MDVDRPPWRVQMASLPVVACLDCVRSQAGERALGNLRHHVTTSECDSVVRLQMELFTRAPGDVPVPRGAVLDLLCKALLDQLGLAGLDDLSEAIALRQAAKAWLAPPGEANAPVEQLAHVDKLAPVEQLAAASQLTRTKPKRKARVLAIPKARSARRSKSNTHRAGRR